MDTAVVAVGDYGACIYLAEVIATTRVAQKQRQNSTSRMHVYNEGGDVVSQTLFYASYNLNPQKHACRDVIGRCPVRGNVGLKPYRQWERFV